METRVVKKSGGQRKPKEIAALDAINTVMTREMTEELLEDAIKWCRQHKSVNGVIKLLSLSLSYQLGMPVKRVASVKMRVEDLLSSVTEMDDGAFDDAIDALYEQKDELP